MQMYEQLMFLMPVLMQILTRLGGAIFSQSIGALGFCDGKPSVWKPTEARGYRNVILRSESRRVKCHVLR